MTYLASSHILRSWPEIQLNPLDVVLNLKAVQKLHWSYKSLLESVYAPKEKLEKLPVALTLL
jgi:hypothetical protein